MRYTQEQIDAAKSIDLYDFILSSPEFSDDFEKKGNSLRREDKNENNEKVRVISVKENTNSYIDWVTMHGGDNIDFLVNIYGYTFNEAVKALLSEELLDKKIIQISEKTKNDPQIPKEIIIPERGPDCKRAFAYLTKKRNIPGDVVNDLINAGLLYQDTFGNAVFISYGKDRIEIRGTNTFKPKFCRTDYVYKDSFWYMGNHGNTVYITEGAIDAVSLYVLMGRKPAIYASLPGVGNQSIIDKITRNGKCKAILAVDNDVAGSIRRACNPNLDTLIPPSPYHDWNEMLTAGIPLHIES